MNTYLALIILGVICYFTVFPLSQKLFGWNMMLMWGANLMGFAIIWMFFGRSIQDI